MACGFSIESIMTSRCCCALFSYRVKITVTSNCWNVTQCVVSRLNLSIPIKLEIDGPRCATQRERDRISPEPARYLNMTDLNKSKGPDLVTLTSMTLVEQDEVGDIQVVDSQI